MMGYYIYPQEPGTEHGPCLPTCKHSDCAASRRDAASLCRICEKPIGYGGRVYFEDSRIVHGLCLELEAEAKR